MHGEILADPLRIVAPILNHRDGKIDGRGYFRSIDDVTGHERLHQRQGLRCVHRSARIKERVEIIRRTS